MKLLYILNIANRVNNFSHTAMLAAKELGIEFHIAGNWEYKSINDRKEDEDKYGICIHQIDFERNPLKPGNIRAYKQLDALMKREKFDAIHCNTPIGGLFGRICGRFNGVDKIIYQAHGFHFFKGASVVSWLMAYPVERILARMTDAIITINNEDYVRSGSFRLRGEAKTYFVKGVGIDYGVYGQDKSIREKKRMELGLGDNDVMLISIGEINKNKNNQVIINAVKALDMPGLHYFLCGKGELEDELVKLTKESGLSDRVHFLGFRNDIKELLSAADIFVLPSFREGLPRSMMEAMASGLACVVSDIRGNRDLMAETKGRGGYLCSLDGQDFADRIKLVASDSNLREEMKKANLEGIRAFGTEEVKNYIKDIYSEIFSNYLR